MDNIYNDAENDSKIDLTELDLEASKTPALIQKWNRLLTEAKFQDKLIKIDLKVLRAQKWEYYSGKSDPDVYMENPPSGKKILKTDIHQYLDMDEEINELLIKQAASEAKVEYLQNALSSMRDRSYSVQAAIKMRIFLSGG